MTVNEGYVSYVEKNAILCHENEKSANISCLYVMLNFFYNLPLFQGQILHI